MTRLVIALVAAFAMNGVWAQAPAGTGAATPAIPPPLENTTATNLSESMCCRVPANTVIALEILDLLNSSLHKRGDKFRLRVISPVVIDGKPVVATGTLGVGEIVHAAPARGGGAPGELLIAARSLDVDGHVVPLRGLKLGVTGGDNSGMVFGVSIAAGPFAMFIRGREIEIPAGTQVHAKVAQDLVLAPAQISSPPTAALEE